MFTEKYPLLLALEDFLPVIFSAIGLFLLARTLNRKNEILGELSHIGAALVVSGGGLNVLWKLRYAVTGNDATWMGKGAFVLMTPGFICLAWALWRGSRAELQRLTAGNVWLLPLFLNAMVLCLSAAISLLTRGRDWILLLLLVTVFATIATSVQLAWQSQRRGLSLTALLFVLNLIVTLVLHGLARRPHQPESVRWIEQLTNTASQALFTFAVFQFTRSQPASAATMQSPTRQSPPA